MDMTDDKLREFTRHLNIQGFRLEMDEKREGLGRIFHEGQEVARINRWGEIFDNMFDNEQMVDHFSTLLDEVDEYMTVFEKAKAVANNPIADEPCDIRTLLSYKDHELNAIRLPDGAIEFDVLTKAGGLTVSHSHERFASAKHEFAYCAGFVDNRLLFPISNLDVVRSALTDYMTSQQGCVNLSKEAKRAIINVIEQINAITFLTEYDVSATGGKIAPPDKSKSRDPIAKESVLEKIKQGKQQTSQQKTKAKKHDKGGPEL